jgi:ribosome maturation factor RimP
MNLTTPQTEPQASTAPQAAGNVRSPYGGVAVDPAVLQSASVIAAAHAAEVYDVALKNEPGGLVLRVLVERAGSQAQKLSTKDSAIDLGVCADIARELSPALDALDCIPQRYNLEVSSPGIERLLRHQGDYERFVGEKIKVRAMLAGSDTSDQIAGRIVSCTATELTLLVETGASSKSQTFAFHSIQRGQLVFEFGANPKSSKNQSSREKKKGT